MVEPLDAAALDRLFREARSRNAWVEEELEPETWRTLHDLVKFGPTFSDIAPARFRALGQGADAPHPRSPRLGFDEACRIA